MSVKPDIVTRLTNWIGLSTGAPGALMAEAASALTDSYAARADLLAALRKICEPITVAANAETVIACQDLHELICEIAQDAIAKAEGIAASSPAREAGRTPSPSGVPTP